jgi:hypothetical protein
VIQRKLLGPTALAISLGLWLVGCRQPIIGEKTVSGNSTNSTNADALKKSIATSAKNSPKAEPRKVRSIAYITPAQAWQESSSAQGDETFTQASYKTAQSQLSVTTIGLPAKGEKAINLVKNCETDFAQGMAKHPELTRSWIKSGFSISRYADPENHTVSSWCATDTCKVQLLFSFPSGQDISEAIKECDRTVDAFFEKNPTGGAKTQ